MMIDLSRHNRASLPGGGHIKELNSRLSVPSLLRKLGDVDAHLVDFSVDLDVILIDDLLLGSL